MFLCQDFNWKKKERSVHTVLSPSKSNPRQSFSHEGWAGTELLIQAHSVKSKAHRSVCRLGGCRKIQEHGKFKRLAQDVQPFAANTKTQRAIQQHKGPLTGPFSPENHLPCKS